MKPTFEFMDGDNAWVVRVIERGANYGRDNCLEHRQFDPLVEFWLEGSCMLSRYYLSTLLAIPYGQGLCPEGSRHDLDVSGEGINAVRAFLRKDAGGKNA